MLKLFYTLLTDPLGLPLEPLYEYIALLILGEIVHEIAWKASPGGTFGSLIYWITKLFAFVAIWAVLYGLITAVKFVIAHWVWFAAGAIIVALLAVVAVFVVKKRDRLSAKAALSVAEGNAE